MDKEEDILNPCGHRNSERIEALKKFPSAVCPACLFERIKELEDVLREIAKSPQYRHAPNWVVIKCEEALKG